MQRLRTLAALMLAALVLVTGTASAAFEASHQLAHGAAGTQLPLPAEHGKAPGHSCSTHLSAHLFAPLESPRDAAKPVGASLVKPVLPAPHAIALPDGLFRPPRFVLQA